MRRTFRFRRRFQQREAPRYRINQFITVPEVRLVDDEGVNVGVISTEKARAMAEERDLDLIEVSPKAVPPVCRLENYGSFKYKEEKEKQKQKAKQKNVEVKGIRLSLNIAAHDRDVRIAKANEFFDEGNKVTVEIILRGREKQHVDLARQTITDFVKLLGDSVAIEQQLTVQGGRLATIVYRKSNVK